MFRRRTDGDDLESFYEVDDEGSPQRLRVLARRMVKLVAGAVSCVVVLVLWMDHSFGAGTGRDLPVAAGSDRPSDATPTVDAAPSRQRYRFPRPPATAPAEPVDAPPAAESSNASDTIATGSDASPERSVPGPAAASSRPASAAAPHHERRAGHTDTAGDAVAGQHFGRDTSDRRITPEHHAPIADTATPDAGRYAARRTRTEQPGTDLCGQRKAARPPRFPLFRRPSRHRHWRHRPLGTLRPGARRPGVPLVAAGAAWQLRRPPQRRRPGAAGLPGPIPAAHRRRRGRRRPRQPSWGARREGLNITSTGAIRLSTVVARTFLM